MHRDYTKTFAVVLVTGWIIYCAHVPQALEAQVKTAPPSAPGAPDATAKKGGKAIEEADVDVPRTPAVPLGPKHIRLHLLDGSVIGGDLAVSEITVKTQFGELVVPIDKIRSFKPGLDSYPKLSQELADKIASLGSDDYKTREQAHKELSAMGGKIQRELEKHVGDENAEIKRHVGEILKEIEEASEEQEDEFAEDASAAEQSWIRQDTVVTTDFTAIGKVAPAEFKINSKYGPLTIALADIRMAERETSEKGSFRRNLSIAGDNLAQRGFKSTGIRVQAGDKISVRAEGSIVMSPWGSNSMSTPDGAQNYGWYIPNQIPGGALIAKIGEKGTVMKVGRQSTFVAKTSGTLQFAIGMQGEYANQGYNFPGEYRLKVKIDPK